MTAIANARQTVAAPTRKPRRFGLLSVVDVVDGGDSHWMLGGLTADGEECSRPYAGEIGCGPSEAKSSRSWYSDLEADPWLSYMYETCKTVGRVNEAASKLRTRFLAAEQSGVESGFQAAVLSSAAGLGSFDGVAQAIGALEAYAAKSYGGQIILHLPFIVAEEASSKGVFERVGDHLETVAGNLVAIGNYAADDFGGSTDAPVLYATGSIVLYRSDLTEVPPQIGTAGPPTEGGRSNDYYVLIERAYSAIVDCFAASATATLCGCGSGGGGGGSGLEVVAPGQDIDLTGEASLSGQSCTAVRNFANGRYEANPQTAWDLNGAGEQIFVHITGGDCNLTWDGTQWQPGAPI